MPNTWQKIKEEYRRQLEEKKNKIEGWKR